MISLRKTLKMVPVDIFPHFPPIIPSGIVIRQHAAPIGAVVKELYFYLPILYIRSIVVFLTLLLAVAAGIFTPYWAKIVDRLFLSIF